MLNETIVLFGLGVLLQATAATAGWWGLRGAGGQRWVWLCLIAACLLWGLRCAIPFWVALNVGLYDFRDAVLAASSSVFCLAAVLGLVAAQR